MYDSVYSILLEKDRRRIGSCLIPFLFQKEAKHDRQLSRPCSIIQKNGKAVQCMKTERLIGILSILLQRDKVTTPELAAQF